MTDRSHDRPVLWGGSGTIKPYSTTARGGKPKVNLPGPARQGTRLNAKFEDIQVSLDEQIMLATSLGASDPQLVIVLEAIDERVDLVEVAKKLGLEVLVESDLEYDPDDDFPRLSKNQDLPVVGCLHAVCASEKAVKELLKRWAAWRNGSVGWGYAKLGELFAHLKDVRAWGPQDRISMPDLREQIEGMLPGDHEVEFELWFRGSPQLRATAEASVKQMIERAGGVVLRAAQVAEIGYHGIKATVDVDLLRRVAEGEYDAIQAVKSSYVMYFRASVQSHAFSEPVTVPTMPEAALPVGDPLLCILDGVPATNHPLLWGRVSILDPDDIAGETDTQSALRRHGTAMASVAIWGDLAHDAVPATRPVLVRPILAPSQSNLSGAEELLPAELAPDLMRRVFRELFDGDGTVPAAAPSVVVINLSVGDPQAPFDGVISAWARTLDWLSAEYGVVVVVSAGNHGALAIPGGAAQIASMTGGTRAQALSDAALNMSPRRSLLAPADAINVVTVGALNSDNAGVFQLGYRIDGADGCSTVSPLSALGPGPRRSVKPELIAPGGRITFRSPMNGAEFLVPAEQRALGPGIAVAFADGHSVGYTSGTSPAAAEVSRLAARAAEVVASIAPGSLSRHHHGAATKALVAHTASVPADLIASAAAHYSHGYGVLGPHLTEGLGSNEATAIFTGSIGAAQECQIDFPLPDGLQQTGIKRITATLGWHSPTNWKHRQYRRAALEFITPTGFTNLDSPVGLGADATKRGTLQHCTWEVTRAVPYGFGDSIQLRVRCKEQAGGLGGELVPFALAVTLWVAEDLAVDVHAQVRTQLAARVGITP